MAQPHTNTIWYLDLHYGNATYLAITHTIPRTFRHAGLWYGNDMLNFHTISISSAGMPHLIWEWYGFLKQFLSNPIFPVNSCDASYYWITFSSFTSQFSEVIISLINALINYSKLGAQYHILCIHQFDNLKLNFVFNWSLNLQTHHNISATANLKKPKTLV